MPNTELSIVDRIVAKLNAFNQRLEARLRRNQTLLENMRAEEALKKVTGTYGRTTEEQGAVKFIDPRHE